MISNKKYKKAKRRIIVSGNKAQRVKYREILRRAKNAKSPNDIVYYSTKSVGGVCAGSTLLPVTADDVLKGRFNLKTLKFK